MPRLVRVPHFAATCSVAWVPDDFDRGRKVGAYEILARLTVGGMAELSLAFLPGPGGFKKFVALKQILPDVRNDEAFVTMFLDEARITAGLSHPNIAQVYELGRDAESGELFLAMEFIAGQNLAIVRKAAKRAGLELPVPIAARIVRDLVLALHAAHTFVDPAGQPLNIVHRDISPRNVMVSYAGHVKVIDFGIARAKGRLTRTQAGELRGTLSYMAPEQLLEEPIDGRTDLYAAGIIMFELLTGTRRAVVDTPTAALEACRAPPIDPGDVVPTVPRRLGAVVVQALCADPAGRFQTGKAFARAIEQACPDFAEEEDVAAFMGGLFEAQVTSSHALFEAAQRDAAPGEFSGLVKRLAALAAVERAAAEVIVKRPWPNPLPPDRPTELAHAATPSKSNVAMIAGIAGLLVVVAIGMMVALYEQEPPLPQPVVDAAPMRRPEISKALRRAEAAMAAQDYEAAAAAWAEVRAAERDNRAAVTGAAFAARKLGRFRDARDLLEQALEHPGGPEEAARLHVELACVLTQIGLPPQAIAELRTAIGLVGLPPLVERLRIESALDPLRGQAEFEALLGHEPTPAPVVRQPAAPSLPSSGSRSAKDLLADGLALNRAQNYEAAAVKLEQCVKADPRSHPCLLALGSAWSRIAERTHTPKDTARARKAYERYLVVAPRGDEFIPRVKKILTEL